MKLEEIRDRIVTLEEMTERMETGEALDAIYEEIQELEDEYFRLVDEEVDQIMAGIDILMPKGYI